MKHWWLQYVQKVEKLTLRERVVVLCAVVLVVGYLIFALAIDPAQQRSRTLSIQIKSQQEELTSLEAQRQALAAERADPEGAVRAQREAATRRIEEADEALKTLHRSLVPAQRVNLLLQDMLKRDPRLNLVSLRTLPVAPLLPERPKSQASGDSAPQAGGKREFSQGNVYKHGVELTVRGGYEDLYQYLARLERSQSRMFWARARLSVEEHPRLSLTLTIYTLSLDKAWLEV